MSFEFLNSLVCLLMQAFSQAAGPVEKPPLVLNHGEQRILRAPGLKRYSPGGTAIKATSLEEEILLKGVQPGTADLWIWKKDGSSEHRAIRVEKRQTELVSPRLEHALSRLDQAEVIYAAKIIVLRGEIESISESARIAALLQAFPGEIRDETQFSSTLLDEAHHKLLEWSRRSPVARDFRVERLEQGIRIQGVLQNPTDRTTIERLIRGIFPAAEIELQSLPDGAPTVHFKVFLLELKKSRFGSLGLGWPDSQPGAFRVSTWGIREAIALDVALQAMEGDGSARVLSNPELVVRAPGEAELFAGGELPIRTHTQYSSNISWKSFGLTLRLKVTHVTVQKARVDILTEVSHLDQKIASDQVPGLQANRMKTQVDARFGEPLLLSGLLQQDMREQARGLPLLRKIPILGKLFGSEDYLNERSELVAILLPRYNAPAAPMHRVEPERLLPKGPVPIPRDWISPEEERQLKQSSRYPWNVFE